NGDDDSIVALLDDPELIALLPELRRLLRENPGIGDVVLEFLEAGEIDLSDPRIATVLPELIVLVGDHPDLVTSLESLTEKLKSDPELKDQLEEALDGGASAGDALDLLADADVADVVRTIAE